MAWEGTFVARLEEIAGGMPLRQLAQMTGHNHETIRRFVLGQAPSVSFVVATCSVFGVSADWLLGLSNKK